jgi:hypothetical protein
VSRRVLMRGPADVTEEAILEAAREWMTPRRSE